MRLFLSSVLFLLLISFQGISQVDSLSQPETNPVILKKLNQWQDLKFGLLMHWGTYSQWGIVESWSLCSEDEPWCTRKMKNYVDYCKAYTNLKSTFNPGKFDPEKWADAAKYAGMKYVVFTTKHHDGFCLFDTKQTNYKITDAGCPFHTSTKADVTAAIFNAFRQEGFWTGAYFSKPDWHSDDYWAQEWATPNRNVNYDIRKYPERWQRFCDYTYNQVEELTTRYGKLDILWLDGGWVCPQNRQDINMPRIASMARKNQPELLIVDRTVTGKYENYRTPEQQVPDTPPDYPWETCMTMATSWSYVPGDIYKPANQLIHLLVEIVAKGGNFLLNIGPSPEGELADTAYARLKEIGDWMKVNSEAIYGTRPFKPYQSGNICFTGLPDGTVYLIYLAAPGENRMPSSIIIRNWQPAAGSSITLLGKHGKLRWNRSGDGCVILVPASIKNDPPCKNAWVLKITK